jgi:hypothetical protein
MSTGCDHLPLSKLRALPLSSVAMQNDGDVHEIAVIVFPPSISSG